MVVPSKVIGMSGTLRLKSSPAAGDLDRPSVLACFASFSSLRPRLPFMAACEGVPPAAADAAVALSLAALASSAALSAAALAMAAAAALA